METVVEEKKKKETKEEKKMRMEKEKAERKPLPPLWAWYDVQWDFITQLCGSVPGNPDIIDAWLKARQPKTKPPTGKTITEIQEEVFDTLAQGEDEPPVSLLVFQRDNGGGRGGSNVMTNELPDDESNKVKTVYTKGDGGLVMRGGTVRAHLKDCARVISYQYMGRLEGEKAFATKVINGLYVDETQYWIPIFKQDDTRVMKPDGNRDKAIHVRGPRGESINALKNFEYIEEARMRFSIKVLGESIKEEDLRILMDYGGTHGYGGERGDGEGKYTFTLTKREVKNV